MDENPVIAGEFLLSGHELGRGSFATVYKGYHRDTRAVVAVKAVDRRKLNSKLEASLESEIQILRTLEHPNVVRMLALEYRPESIYLVMEFCAWGDLSTYLKRKRGQNLLGGVPPSLIYHFLAQMSSALQALRQRSVVHRDLKPQNILLVPPAVQGSSANSANSTTSAGRWPLMKLGDFGFAKQLQRQDLADTLCGSPLYMAPEILGHEKYDAKADLWSLGAILYELITGKPPFVAANHIALLRKIKATKIVSFPAEAFAPVAESAHPPPPASSLVPGTPSADFTTVAYDYAASLGSPRPPTGSGNPLTTSSGSLSSASNFSTFSITASLKQLAQSLLTVNPVERIGFEEFFLHPLVRTQMYSAPLRDSDSRSGSMERRSRSFTIPPEPRPVPILRSFGGESSSTFDLEEALGSMIIGIPSSPVESQLPPEQRLGSEESTRPSTPFTPQSARSARLRSQSSGDGSASSSKSPSPFPSLPNTIVGAFQVTAPPSAPTNDIQQYHQELGGRIIQRSFSQRILAQPSFGSAKQRRPSLLERMDAGLEQLLSPARVPQTPAPPTLPPSLLAPVEHAVEPSRSLPEQRSLLRLTSTIVPTESPVQALLRRASQRSQVDGDVEDDGFVIL